MKLIFFDEVKNSNDYPHYHIGAICIDEEHLHEIEAEVSKLAKKVFKDSVVSKKLNFMLQRYITEKTTSNHGVM